jgi:HlyD family secretion protein
MNKPVATGTARIEVAVPADLSPKITAPARSPFRKVWLIGGLLAALLAAAAIAWWLATAEAPVRYTTAPVTRGAISRGVTATGTVNPELTIIVGTYVSGVIQQLFCDYNTQVKKGQVCARIDPRPYQTVVDQNRANLAAAKAQVEKSKVGLAYAQLTYDRMARLGQTNAVSKDAVDNAKNLLDQARAQVGVDEADIALHQAQLATAQVNLDYTDIVSPVDGIVVSRNVTMGQTVAASFQTPTLFLIASDLTKMQADTNVSESDIGGIKLGDKATFTVDAYPKRTFAGAVTQVRQSPQTVQNVVTYDVVVSVDNSDLMLKPGMTAANRIVTDQRDDVLRVPSQALRYAPATAGTGRRTGASGRPRPADQGRVWVLRDGKPVRIAVTTGLDDDSYTEIVKGEINPDDQVIIAEQRSNNSSSSSRPSAPRLR